MILFVRKCSRRLAVSQGNTGRRLQAEVRRSAGWKTRVENGGLLVAILGGIVGSRGESQIDWRWEILI